MRESAVNTLLALLITIAVAEVTDRVARAESTIYGCANSHGRVRLITTSPPTCRATETAVSWNQQGPKGDKGNPGAPGNPGLQGPPGPGLVVKDSTGVIVGIVVDVQSDRPCSVTNPSTGLNICGALPIRVGRTIAGRVMTLFVDESGLETPVPDLRSPSSTYLWYDTDDCSGQPLLAVDGAQPFVPYLRKYGSTGAYPDALTGTAFFHAVKSVQYGPAAPCLSASNVFNQNGLIQSTTIFAAPATLIDVSELNGLVPPFHVEGP